MFMLKNHAQFKKKKKITEKSVQILWTRNCASKERFLSNTCASLGTHAQTCGVSLDKQKQNW